MVLGCWVWGTGQEVVQGVIRALYGFAAGF